MTTRHLGIVVTM